jgi:hypothetical protein
VVGDDRRDIVDIEGHAAAGGDRDGTTQQRPSGGGSERHNDPTSHRPQFRLDPRMARLDFCRVRLLVQPPLAPQLVLEMLDGIRCIHRVAIDIGILQAGPQHAASGSHERTALAILLIAGLFADQHDRRRPDTLAEHDLLGVGVERATLTGLCRLREFGQ